MIRGSDEMNKLPTSVKIIDQIYSIEYVDNPSKVDIFNRKSLWGQIDYWTRSIRIYRPSGYSNFEVWNSIIHEILHGIIDGLKIEEISGLGCDNEEHIVHLLATGLNAVLNDNAFLFLKGKGEE